MLLPIVVLGVLLAGAAEGEAAREPSHVRAELPAVPGELIVGLAAGVSDAEADRLLAAAGAQGGRKLRRVAAKLARIDPARRDAVLKRLRSDPRVRFAEPNYKVSALRAPNDPALNQLWGLVNTGQTVNGVSGTPDADIDADAAWDVTTGSSSVVVGVIDTGVDFSHPDLAANRWTNPGETGAGRETNGVDDDANGYVDDWRGWDWANDDNDPTDDNNHGTHVAGIIGGVGDNGQGLAGVNWNVKIMALKFLDFRADGDLADAVEALRYATTMGARITNNSWGGGGFSQAMFDQLKAADAAGALFVAAAGNNGADNDTTPVYPASYDVPNVLTVAATDQNDGLWTFSNRGRTSVDVGAPGTQVYSTVPGGGYNWFTGTSMAAPHVAGTAALAAAAFPSATAAGLKTLLLRTVDPKAPLAGVTTSEGRVNAGRAVTCANAPTAWVESPKTGFTVAANEALPVTVLAANCASAAGVSVVATANGTPIALNSRGDGLYTGTYTPTTAGPLTITVNATVGAATDSRSAAGTVEDGGYRLVQEPFAWVDATAGGTRLTSLGDDSSATVTLPFAFRFFGQSFGSVSVSSNGFLAFGGGAATQWVNAPIPSTAAPNGLVAAYWDDLDPSQTGAVWHRTIGTAPNRKLVISWIGVRHVGAPGPITFQAVLEETSNEIVLAYQDTLHNSPSLDHGASATIGLESPDATIGHQFGHNQAVLGPYQGTTALRYALSAPPPPDTQAPAAPTGLTAGPGELRVSLAWTANVESDLTGYHVYRRNTDGTWTRIATTTGTGYTDTAVTAGTPYTYRITAFDRATPPNESAPSAEATATPTADLTPPAPPTGLQAAAGDRQVTLDWPDNTDPVAGYRVYRDGAPIANVTVSSYTDTGLTNGSLYSYRVTALDQPGNESGPSNEVPATPQASQQPPDENVYRVVEEPVAWIDATAGGTRLTSLGDDSSATVALPFAFRFFGQPFTSVAVSSNGFLVFGGGAATEWTNSSIPNAAAPNGLVAPYWDDLDPTLSGGAVWHRTIGTAPNRKLVVSWIGVRHVSAPGAISFQAVLEETSNEIVFAYEDTLHDSAGFNHGASATIGIENPTGTLGFQFGHNQALLGPYQATTALRYTNRSGPPPPPDVTPPNPPTGLQATEGDRQVALDWADNTDAVAGYRVYRDGVRIATPTASVYTDTGLTNGTAYGYRVTAVDQAGNESGPSNEVSATPQASQQPPDENVYRVVQEPFAWIDATAGGTRLTSLGDDSSATVTLPFAFRFFGQPFTSVAVSSNGFLVLGGSTATAWVNNAIPNAAAPNGLVAPYWDDLDPTLSGGAVWHRTIGTAPNRRLVVSWIGVRHVDAPGPITFQAVLEETTNEIVFAYEDTLHDSAGFNHGASATIGIENPTGTLGFQFGHNQPLLGPLQGTTSLRYTNR